MSEVVICLTSHDRIDCARINQEIIKLNYKTRFTVVHACSGTQKEPYLEDTFVWCEPMPLHIGAINLIQESLRLALKFDPKWIVHLEADTWLLDENVLLDYLRRMEERPAFLLAASAWMEPNPSRFGRAFEELGDLPWARGKLRRLRDIPKRMREDMRELSTQLFVMRADPLLVDGILSMRPDNHRVAERQFFDAFVERFDLAHLLRMTEREPVHPHNRWSCPRIALYSEHWPAAGTAVDSRPKSDPLRAAPSAPGKKEALLRHPEIRKGDALNRLLAATDYAYYNPGAGRC